MKQTEEKSSTGQLISSTMILVIVTVLAITAVSYAWFSISRKSQVDTLKMDITTGRSLRIDTVAHESYEEYKPSLSFDDIRDYVLNETGQDFNEIKLMPVTTSDGKSFTYEKGDAVPGEDFAYIQYTLHFISDSDVYLNLSAKETASQLGTLISSNSAAVTKALRISFTSPDGNTLIYDPDGTVDYTKYGKDTFICSMQANKDVPVVIRIWLEGNDPECTNAIKTLDFAIRMRFEATDSDFAPLT